MRMLQIRLVLGCLGAAAVIVASGGLHAEDWPQWRGPRGDGISHETGLADHWPDAGPKHVWSVKVGNGYSSPVAVDGKIYIFAVADRHEVLYALDADTGKELWHQPSPGAWANDHGGTRATPTVDGKFIYTYGSMGDLICRNLADGSIVWQENILKATGGTPIQWGQSSSPLIDGDVIYVQGGVKGAAAVALNKKTGAGVWKSQAIGGSYAQPILIDINGTRQLVVFAQSGVADMNLTNGQTLWGLPWKTEYDVNAATPIYRDGHLFVTSGYGSGCMMIEVTATGAKKAWENKSIASKFQAPVLDGDALYGNNDGTITCLSWPDGAVKWSSGQDALRIGTGGSFVRVGDRLVALSERGKLMLLKATPAGIEKISVANHFVEGNEIWSMPLIYNGKLYVKGIDELVCADLSGK